MPRTKQITVQAKVNGKIVFDRTIDGKKNYDDLMRECMSFIDTLGAVSAIIRRQVVGAKGWALFEYMAGGKCAVPNNRLAWE